MTPVHRLVRSAGTTAALAAILAPAALAGQGLLGMGDPIAQADLLYFAGQPEAAYALLHERVEAQPDDYETLWRVARAAVVVGIGFDDHRDQNRYLDPALHFAERAVALQPDSIDGLYWRGVAAGRRAMNAGPGYAVELAQVVYDDAYAILSVDSTHAGAHNMLGKLNYEVMSLSRFERAVARIFMGNEALSDTSWEKAEHHLAKAVEFSPDFVLFQFDLGELYRKRDRDEEAVTHLQAAMALPVVQPIDVALQERAARLLDEIEG